MAWELEDGNWRNEFRAHIIGLELFLTRRKGMDGLRDEMVVYLAGMVARSKDAQYLSQIQDYLVEDEDEIQQAIRRHDPYIGQNAPIVFLSRINAEHLTLELAADSEIIRRFQLRTPARYYGIASYYSLQSGHRSLAQIYDFLRTHIPVICGVLGEYLEEYETGAYSANREQDSILWQRIRSRVGERHSLSRDTFAHLRQLEGWQEPN